MATEQLTYDQLAERLGTTREAARAVVKIGSNLEDFDVLATASLAAEFPSRQQRPSAPLD